MLTLPEFCPGRLTQEEYLDRQKRTTTLHLQWWVPSGLVRNGSSLFYIQYLLFIRRFFDFVCDFVCRMFQDLEFQALLRKKARAEVGAWQRQQRLRRMAFWAFWVVLLLVVALAVSWATGRTTEHVASSPAGPELKENLRSPKEKVG